MPIRDIITSNQLTYEQKVLKLAREAENSQTVLNIPDAIQTLRDKGVICDLFEGAAPYRPRYIVPDYNQFVENGSRFLKLDPPTNLDELLNNLLILYSHVPSITSFPVFIGRLDELIDPFLNDLDEENAYQAIKRFMIHIDRTISDSFCHANIGPEYLKATKLILRAEKELDQTVPNLTLRVADDSDEKMILQALDVAMTSAKPSFARHEIFKEEFGPDYAIASCYNGLPIGGGSYTLSRLNLHELAKGASDKIDYLERLLPDAALNMMEYMDQRVRFIHDESNFFESSFLAKEGLINPEKFTAMFGVFGLAEAVNTLMDNTHRFGHAEDADRLGVEIIEKLESVVIQHQSPLLRGTEGHYLLHSQVGIDTDDGSSPGCRIPIGEEPEILSHIKQASRYHRYFPSGIGDIFQFEPTYRDNLRALYDILRGSFNQGMRYISFYASDSDIVRISGYLVKRSEIEKLNQGEAVQKDTVELGKGAAEHLHVLERKVRK
jgi:YjjI family glycine radical enzyme